MAENVLGTMVVRTRAESTVPQDLAPSVKSVREFGQSATQAGQAANTGLGKASEAAKGAAGSTDTLTAAQRRLLTQMERQTARASMTASEYAAWRAQQAGISNEAQPFITRMRESEKATQGAGQATNTAATASERFVQQLREQVETMGMTQMQLMEYKAAQLGVADQARPLLTRLADVDNHMRTGGMSAKQTAAAMRMLPAQFTDIATSIAGGMPLYLIAIQQGGQIRDSFGGVGASLRAIMTLITPMRIAMTLGGTAVGALAYAAYQGHTEVEKLEEALVSGGNAAGLSARALKTSAAEVGRLTGEYGLAREAALSLASSGQVSADALAPVMRAVVAEAAMSGAELDKLLEKYEKLADDPVDAIEKLSKSHGFFTHAIYEQVEALVAQGRESEAVALAQRSLADETIEQQARVRRSTSTLEWAWDQLKRAASGAWDAMMNIGRPTSTADLAAQAAALEAEIARIRLGSGGFATTGGGAAVGGGANQQARVLENLQKRLVEIQDQIRADADQALEDDVHREKRAAEQRKIAAQARLNEQAHEIRTQKQRRQEEIDQAKRDAKEVGWTAEQLAAHLARIEEKYKDKATSGGISGPNANALAGVRARIEQERQLIVELDAQYDALMRGQSATAKLTEGEKALLDVQEKLRAATSAGVRTRLQEQEALVRTQIGVEKERVAKEARNKAQEDFEKLRDRERDSHVREIDGITQRAILLEQEVGTYGLGRAAVERMTIARLREQQAVLMGVEGSEEQRALIEQEIRARERLMTVTARKEALDANEKAANEAGTAWTRVTNQVGQSLSDQIMRGGRTGKEYVQDLFRTMILRPSLEPLMNGGMNAVGQFLGMPGASRADGLAGGAFGTVNNLSTLWSAVSGGLTSSIASGVASIGSAIGSSAVSSFAAGMKGSTLAAGLAGPTTAGASGAMGAGAMFANALPWVAGAFAVYQLASAFMNDPETRVGAQYGLASEGMLYNPRRGTARASDNGVQFLEGPSGGGASAAVQQAIQGTVDGINGLLKTTGVELALTSFWAAYEGSEKGRGGVGAGGTLSNGAAFGESGRGDNYRGTLFDPSRPFSLSPEEALNMLPAQLAQASLQAWQSAADQMPPTLARILRDVDLASLDDNALMALRDQFVASVAMAEQLRAGLEALSFVPATARTFSFATALADAAGGAEQAASLVTGYFGNFFTEAERLAYVTETVSSRFRDMNMVMPTSREEYRAMVDAAFAMGDAGAATVARLLGMQEDLAAVFTAADAASSAVASQRLGLEQQLLQLQGDTAELRRRELESLDPANRALQERIWAIQDEQAATTSATAALDAARASAEAYTQTLYQQAVEGAQTAMGWLSDAIGRERQAAQSAHQEAMSGYQTSLQASRTAVSELSSVSRSLGSALQSMRLESSAYDQLRRSAAQQQLREALQMARAGGSLRGLDLSAALSELTRGGTGTFGTYQEYAMDWARTAHEIAELQALTDKQLTAEERIATNIERRMEQASRQHDAAMRELDVLQEEAQKQLNALLGIEDGVMPLPAALQALAAAMGKLASTPAPAKDPAPTASSQVSGWYSNLLGRPGDAGGIAYWEAEVRRIGAQRALEDFLYSARSGGELPRFASGGLASGWAMVGEEGPEVVDFRSPGRVYTADQTRGMFAANDFSAGSGAIDRLISGLMQRIDALTYEVTQLRAETRAVVLNTGKTAKTLDRVTPRGDAILVRAAA